MATIGHYVPQFLLDNFCAPGKNTLWAYDKSTGKSFQTSVRNIARERDYYEAEIGGRILSLEEALSNLEGKAGVIIGRIIASRCIGGLSEQERIVLAMFVAIQMKRGPNHRQHIQALSVELKKVLGGGDFDPAILEGYQEMTAEDAKVHSLISMTEPDKFAEHILDKTWLLFETDATEPYYLSDNPVVLQNSDETPGRGNLGLASAGIEIYLPISSTLLLGFYCHSHEQMIRSGVDRARTTVVRHSTEITPSFGPMLDWMRAFRKGTPIKAMSGNVLNHNALQVHHAERYLLSSLPDFSLVEDMIANEPRYRIGPRPQIV